MKTENGRINMMTYFKKNAIWLLKSMYSLHNKLWKYDGGNRDSIKYFFLLLFIVVMLPQVFAITYLLPHAKERKDALYSESTGVLRDMPTCISLYRSDKYGTPIYGTIVLKLKVANKSCVNELDKTLMLRGWKKLTEKMSDNANVQKIEVYYLEKGYYGSDFRVNIWHLKDNKLELKFEEVNSLLEEMDRLGLN